MKFILSRSQTEHIVHGIKTGGAAVIAFFAANFFNLKYGYWAALTAVIVMQISVADSIKMCWYRFSGTAIGALIAILCMVIFPQNPPMTIISLFLSVCFCAYMTRYNERFKMAAITTTIVMLASIGEPDRIEYGLFRVIEIGLGVASAFLVSVLVWPMRASESLKDELFTQFEECARNYETLMDGFLHNHADLSPSMLDSFNSKMSKNRGTYLKIIRHEKIIYSEDTDLLNMKINTLERCASHLRAMLHTLNNTEDIKYEIIMEPELLKLAEATSTALRDIGSKRIPDELMLETALNSAQTKLESLRSEGATRRFYLQKLIQFFAFYHSAQFICKDLLHYTRERKRIKGMG